MIPETRSEADKVGESLLPWWDRHGRKDLPWQREPTPYRVWVSEIMLQQTQVATVTRYYDRFMAAFPDVVSLANAPADQVLHLWSGLGYYARARNLHRAAGIIRDEWQGELPDSLDELITLPGIGRSTAGAIQALARGERQPILDGNVKRVLARIFCVEGWPGRSAVASRLWELAEACTPRERVSHYTQAIMDLGASICTRKNPECEVCPLSGMCGAYASGVIDRLPGKAPKKGKPRRATVLVLVRDNDGALLLERRPDAGIWGGLWGFPEITSVEAIPDWLDQCVGSPVRAMEVRKKLRHSFTHFDLDLTPVTVDLQSLSNRVMDGDRWLWYNVRQPASVGLAAPVSRLIQEYGERP